MSKLYFYYSAMNAGKSTMLLQASYNYKEIGLNPILFTPTVDNRTQISYIYSRLGIKKKALVYDNNSNIFNIINNLQKKVSINCILVDEAHFLKKKQVAQLTYIVDEINIPVLTYGLRSDFKGEPFEGSTYLLTWADKLIEIKTICYCGKKAIYNLRFNKKGIIENTGPQIKIGGNDIYKSVCRKHYNKNKNIPKPI